MFLQDDVLRLLRALCLFLRRRLGRLLDVLGSLVGYNAEAAFCGELARRGEMEGGFANL